MDHTIDSTNANDALFSSTPQPPSVMLIASQIPQQELGLIAQLLQSQGYTRKTTEPKGAPELIFTTDDGNNTVTIKFYQDIGALRLELIGDTSLRIGAALGQYLESLSAERIGEFFEKSTSDMERRIYAILCVLTYPDAKTAMRHMRKSYIDDASDATREGVIQGLAFLETKDVGEQLEILERDFKETNLAKLCRKAIDGLSERGVIRESIASFIQKIQKIIDENPKLALENIEKYLSQGEEPKLRALHAKALHSLGRNDEALNLLTSIDISDPDASDAFCQRALLRETQGFPQNALQDAQSALVVDPQNKIAQEIFNRLRLTLSQNHASNDDKRTQLDKLLQTTPDDPNLRIQRAQCYCDMGNDSDDNAQKAIDDLKHAQKFAPNDPRLPLLLAKAYRAKRYLGSALEQATIAQKIHAPSQNLDAWLIKPLILLAIDDPSAALNAIHEIPTDVRILPAVALCTAIIDERLGRNEEAETLYTPLKNDLAALFNALSPTLYDDLPILRRAMSVDTLPLSPRPKTPLDLEPTDPLFKRCKSCGALTIKRRTQCRECGSTEFFC